MPPRTELFPANRSESSIDSQSSIGVVTGANNDNGRLLRVRGEWVRKSVSGVRRGRLTDHWESSVYDGDSVIRAAVAEDDGTNWRAWS